jgi:hypothetical protein
LGITGTAPDSLANKVLLNINEPVSYKPLHKEGAQNAAEMISGFIMG